METLKTRDAPAGRTTQEPLAGFDRPVAARRIERTLLVAATVLGLLHLAVLGYHTIQLIRFPFDVNYGEGYVLNDALRLARGEQIYVGMREFPMVRSPYPPLVPALLGALAAVVGPEFWPGRALAAVCMAAVVGLVFWNALRAGGGPWVATVATTVVAASPYVYQWAGYVRVDWPSLLFTVSAVLVAQWMGGWRAVLLAAVLSGLGVWSKQTAVSAPIAITLAFLLSGRRAQGVVFVLLQALPSLALLLWLESTSAGQFSRHVLFGNALNPFNLPRMFGWMGLFILLQWPLLAAGVWWAGRAWRSKITPLALYVPLALLTTFSVGNEGSAQNYLLEAIVACGLAVPFAWRALPARLAGVGPILAVVQLALVFHLPNGGLWYPAQLPLHNTPVEADYVNAARVDAAIHAEPRQVMAEAAGFALRDARPVYIQPLDLRAEEHHGRWDSTPLLDALRRGDFGLVVEVYRLLPFGVEAVLASEFELVEEIPAMNGFTYRLFRPLGSARHAVQGSEG